MVYLKLLINPYFKYNFIATKSNFYISTNIVAMYGSKFNENNVQNLGVNWALQCIILSMCDCSMFIYVRDVIVSGGKMIKVLDLNTKVEKNICQGSF